MPVRAALFVVEPEPPSIDEAGTKIRATVWKTIARSSSGTVRNDGSRFSAGFRVRIPGARLNVIRTASGIPQRLNFDSSDVRCLSRALAFASPHVSYQVRPS